VRAAADRKEPPFRIASLDRAAVLKECLEAGLLRESIIRAVVADLVLPLVPSQGNAIR
jgi:hypothetical protein